MNQRKQILLTGIIALCIMCVLLTIYTTTQHHSERPINTSKTGKRMIHGKEPGRKKNSEKGDNVSSKDLSETVSMGQESKEKKKEKLLKHFKSIKVNNNQTIAGAYLYDVNSTVPHIGEIFPAILTMDIPDHLLNVDEWKLFVNNTIIKWNNGYLVHLVWGVYENPITSNAILTERNEIKWADLSTQGGQLNKVWKNELDKLAPYLQQLLNAGVVPICDILPFINFDRHLWNGRPGTNGSLKFYQMTYDYLTRHHGLSSIIWVWSIYVTTSFPSIEEYWPGNDYVDVASFYMGTFSQLKDTEYQNILSFVGDKPISMEWMDVVPTIRLLAAQSRWTWFTLNEDRFRTMNVNQTFTSSSVITQENNEYFNIID